MLSTESQTHIFCQSWKDVNRNHLNSLTTQTKEAFCHTSWEMLTLPQDKLSTWQEALSVALLLETLCWVKTCFLSTSNYWTTCFHPGQHLSVRRHPPQESSSSYWEGPLRFFYLLVPGALSLPVGHRPELLQNVRNCHPKKAVEHFKEQAKVCSSCWVITCLPHLTSSESFLVGLLPLKWVNHKIKPIKCNICPLCKDS